MNLQKLKAGNEIYFSTDLLDQCHSIESFSNVKLIMLEYGSTSKEVTNNIIYNELKDEYKLEEFNKTNNTQVIVETDMFGKKKLWIKDGAYASFIFEKLKESNCLSFNVLEDVIEESLKDYYKNNKLNISILNGLGNTKRKEAYQEFTQEEMIENFVNIAKNKKIDFHIENNGVNVTIKPDIYQDIKNDFKDTIEKKLCVKNVLKNKASTLNELIQDYTAKPKNKIKP
jgi:hypothetical protein